MNAYKYDPITLIYEGVQKRQIDPVATKKAGKDIFLMPAFCTNVEMTLDLKDNYDIVFDGSTWIYKEQEKKEDENTSDDNSANATDSTETTIEQRISDLEDAVQSIMFTE